MTVPVIVFAMQVFEGKWPSLLEIDIEKETTGGELKNIVAHILNTQADHLCLKIIKPIVDGTFQRILIKDDQEIHGLGYGNLRVHFEHCKNPHHCPFPDD